jgi:hypothetical protein
MTRLTLVAADADWRESVRTKFIALNRVRFSAEQGARIRSTLEDLLERVYSSGRR